MNIYNRRSLGSRNRASKFTLVLRKDEPEWKTKTFLHSFVKDVDKLVKENNP